MDGLFGGSFFLQPAYLQAGNVIPLGLWVGYLGERFFYNLPTCRKVMSSLWDSGWVVFGERFFYNLPTCRQVMSSRWDYGWVDLGIVFSTVMSSRWDSGWVDFGETFFYGNIIPMGFQMG
jgi:hypothetical protein